jgi:glutathione peroxidase-family protein
MMSSTAPPKHSVLLFAFYNNRDVYSFTLWHCTSIVYKNNFYCFEYNKFIDLSLHRRLQLTLKSIYDIDLESATGEPGFLDQFKGKATLVVNTTVGCGNANQMEVLQDLQDKYGGDHFQVVAIPTNDYCGPGITHGKWSEGITCGLDSANYGKDVYGTTFKFSEMVSSIPNFNVSHDLGVEYGHNGLNEPFGEPHELYLTIRSHQEQAREKLINSGLNPRTMFEDKYFSHWLNMGFYNGTEMGGNFEKYLVDKDGFVSKHYQCTILNKDSEKTVKEMAEVSGADIGVGLGRSKKIFEEEWSVICQDIEELIAGKKSIINPVSA